jgi:Flp pilus assembly protein TadG
VQNVNFLRKRNHGSDQRGQIIPMFAVFLVVMLMFVALAIDLGYAYVTKANLSKAVDAAALRGMLSIAQGTDQAAKIAQSVFAANYKLSGRDNSTPVPTVTFVPNPPVPGTLTKINVSATTNINTFFARILPGMQTVTVGDTAQSTRANVMMTLVLDRSGSMNDNGGAQALPPAVQTFVSYFSDTLDQAAVSTFSSTARLDLAMKRPFTTDVTNVVNGLVGNFGGGTYSQGGLDYAASQLCGWAVPGTYPYAGGCPVVINTTKVVVFFTDGWANSNVDALNSEPNGAGCPATPVYYGGCAPPEAAAGWCSGVGFWDANQNTVRGCYAQNFPAKEPRNLGRLPGGPNPTPAQITNAQNDISTDAMYRAMKWANAMRAQGVIVYAVGLGDKIEQSFLQQMANDPNGTSFEGFSYNANAPQGLAVFAVDCPGPSCTSELNQAFQTVATDILLKITQ